MGVGIHGEPETHREKVKNANEYVEYMMSKLLDEAKLNKNDEIALMINVLSELQ